LNSALPCIDEAYSPAVFEYVYYRTYVAVEVTFPSALLVGLAEVAATHGLLLNKSCVDQILSSTATVNENPPACIKLSLYLFYVLARLAEKLFELRGDAVEKDWANGRGRPRTVIVLDVHNDVESCGVLPRVELKLIGLDSSLHD
jgi:hypothetical protein